MKKYLAALLLVPLATQAAPETTCKHSPDLIGACRMVKGSLGLTPDVGVTIETQDGHSILIKAPSDSDADIAPKVMQNWLYWQSRSGSMKTRIQGTFEVCPLPADANPAGIRDFACINNASRITVDKSTMPAK